MKHIVLKNIKLDNFMGYAHFEYDFADKLDSGLVGESGTGKTSVIEAVKFVLGLNVPDYQPSIEKRKIMDLSTRVELIINVDDLSYKLSVASDQQWKTNKDNGEKEFIGNLSTYMMDGIECTKKVYVEKLELLFGQSIQNLNLLFDVKAFNNDTPNRWTWVQRRKFFFDNLNLQSIIATLSSRPEYFSIREDIEKGKDEIDIQKALNMEKKTIQDTLAKNQTLMEDRANKIASYSGIDFASLETKKEEVHNRIVDLQNSIANSDASLLIAQKQVEINNLKQEAYSVKSKYESEKKKLERDIFDVEAEIYRNEKLLAYTKEDLTKCTNESILNDNKLDEVQNRTYSGEQSCPYCHQPLPDSMIHEAEQSFAKQKEIDIKELRATAINIQNKQQSLEIQEDNYTKLIGTLKDKLATLKGIVIEAPNTSDIENKIIALNNDIMNADNSVILADAKSQIAGLRLQYDNTVKQLCIKDEIANLQKEIDTFKLQNQGLAIQDGERILKQNQLKDYIQEKVSLINSTINSYFSGNCSFLLANKLTASAEQEYEMTCEIMFDGVPYRSLSNGQKILADVLVAKGLRNILGIDVPIFFDERQSVTYDFSYEGQVIELLTKANTKTYGSRIKDIYTIKDCM